VRRNLERMSVLTCDTWLFRIDTISCGELFKTTCWVIEILIIWCLIYLLPALLGVLFSFIILINRAHPTKSWLLPIISKLVLHLFIDWFVGSLRNTKMAFFINQWCAAVEAILKFLLVPRLLLLRLRFSDNLTSASVGTTTTTTSFLCRRNHHYSGVFAASFSRRDWFLQHFLCQCTFYLLF
jgi:hypothetical protein